MVVLFSGRIVEAEEVMMTTATATITLNAAFLKEIKEDHHELWQLLDHLRSHCHDGAWRGATRRELYDLLDQLRDRLAMHFALEEAFGYFEDAVGVAPRLSEKVESLRLQHGRLFVEVCSITDEADDLLHHEAPMGASKRITARFSEFFAALQQHEDAENGLISDAFNDDVGVGD